MKTVVKGYFVLLPGDAYLVLDKDKNLAAKGGDDISVPNSKVRIYVVDTNEEIIVARKAQSLLAESANA